jgi:FkbM family methyltransferase
MTAAMQNIDIEALLSEGVEEVARRERSDFDRFAGPFAQTIVLFGAGNMGRTIQRKLKSIGLEIAAFVDNNQNLWGQQIGGVPVLSPADGATKFATSAAFVVSIWGVGSRDRMASRVSQLRELGCRTVIPFPALFWKHSQLFLPYCMIDLPSKVQEQASQIREAAALWTDDFSRREFAAQINWRLNADFNQMADPVPETVYFPEDLFALNDRELFVDCGAYDGDSIGAFLRATDSKFEQIVAFEPDPSNFSKLHRYVGGLPDKVSSRIELRQQATAAYAGLVHFAALGTDGSAIGEGDLEVECVTLDQSLGSGCSPTHIKMDIEGAELDALEGARGTIARNKPVLAICAYHRQSDIWEIPLLIHSIEPGYKLFLRPHLFEGWDSVCYAIPPQGNSAN